MNKEERLEFLLKRQKGVGASDVGAIMGMNPYKSALQIWYDKVTPPVVEEEENIPAELGEELESYLVRKFIKWYDRNINTDNDDFDVYMHPETIEHPELDILKVNLDAELIHIDTKKKAVVECKTAGEWVRGKWEDDEMPDHYYLQVQAQLAASGYEIAYVPYLIGNRKFDVKIVERNEEVIKLILNAVKDFWNGYVLPRVPPAPDGSASAGMVLNELYPKEAMERVIELAPFGPEVDMLEKYDKLSLQLKEINREIDLIKQTLKAEMKDAEVALIGEYRVTWKEQLRKAYSVPESKSRVLRILKNKGVKKNG